MEQFMIRIADRVIAVSAQYKQTRNYCADYLCDGKPDFSVLLTSSDAHIEKKSIEREQNRETVPAQSVLERTALQRKIAEMLFAYNTIIFHGSVIAVDGEGYIFTAKSGTGKSTHTRLWREMLGDQAVMVNDDKPFLLVGNSGVQAYGSPWNGKHGLGNNINVPVKAICILERGEQNEISRINAKEALPVLLQQSYRPQQPNLLPKYMELIAQIANNTSFYRLKCNMDPEAALISYQTMSGRVKEK